MSSLTKTYAQHAKRLRATGEGVNADDSGDGPGAGSSGEHLNFYIGGEGPCVETPHHARNIWGMSIPLLTVILLLKGLNRRD